MPRRDRAPDAAADITAGAAASSAGSGSPVAASSASAGAGDVVPAVPAAGSGTRSERNSSTASSGSTHSSEGDDVLGSSVSFTLGERARRKSRSLARASRLRFWDARSPNFRFFVLGLAMLVPFGGHVIKYSVSSLHSEMLEDKEFGLDHFQLGMFQSAVSIPNLFMPFIGGVLLDNRGSAPVTLAALALCLIGHFSFIVSCSFKSLRGAVLSRVLFGMGQGSTVVAQGRILATFFAGREIVFAVAIIESVHNLSNCIAFIYVVPASRWLGGYIYALWIGLSFSALSFIAGLIFFRVSSTAQPTVTQLKRTRQQQQLAREQQALLQSGRVNEAVSYSSFAERHAAASAPRPESPMHPSPCSSAVSEISSGDELAVYDAPPPPRSLNPLSGLSVGFFLLCLVHMVYSNATHLFNYVSAALIRDRFHTEVEHAGWLAGLSNGIAIFLCPIAGWLVDYLGYKMSIQAAAGVLTSAAYLLMLSSSVSPVPSLILLAICVSFTPTILRSSVPNLVLPHVFGVGYGIYEISESLGSVLGNPLVGYVRDTTHGWDADLLLFAGMGGVATLLTLLLIFIDRWGWVCFFGPIGAGERRAGSLNQSSVAMGLEYDRLQRSKDRFLQKERRWREVAKQQQEEKRQEDALRRVEDGMAKAQQPADGV